MVRIHTILGGQRDLVNGLIMGITMVTIWVIGSVFRLTGLNLN